MQKDWITINGTHVLVGDDGNIQYGPENLKNSGSGKGSSSSKNSKGTSNNAKGENQTVKVKDGQTLNQKESGKDLYKVNFTPKGTKDAITVNVWAKNRIDASNYLITHQLYGKQNGIEYATSNALNHKEEANKNRYK